MCVRACGWVRACMCVYVCVCVIRQSRSTTSGAWLVSWGVVVAGLQTLVGLGAVGSEVLRQGSRPDA